jgi:hypothetical protein
MGQYQQLLQLAHQSKHQTSKRNTTPVQSHSSDTQATIRSQGTPQNKTVLSKPRPPAPSWKKLYPAGLVWWAEKFYSNEFPALTPMSTN